MSSNSAAAATEEEAEEEGAALPMDMDFMADFAPFVESAEEDCLGALVFVSKTTPETRTRLGSIRVRIGLEQAYSTNNI